MKTIFESILIIMCIFVISCSNKEQKVYATDLNTFIASTVSTAGQSNYDDSTLNSEEINQTSPSNVTNETPENTGELYSNDVTIGKQVWMTKNLDVVVFRNGDTIPNASTEDEWIQAGKNRQPAWCYYDYTLWIRYDGYQYSTEQFGKLYNWYAVNDRRGLVPEGWHLPSETEWNILAEYLGEGSRLSSIIGRKMKSPLEWIVKGKLSTAPAHWTEPPGIATNESGFSGLPGGYCNGLGECNDIRDRAYWWSSTENNTVNSGAAVVFSLDNDYGGLSKYDIWKNYGCSVRCLRD